MPTKLGRPKCAIPTLALALLLAAPAAADEPQQLPCNTREKVVATLAREFDERVVAGGVTDGGGLIVEIFASAAGTWTAVTTSPDGRSCLVQSGRGWRVVVPVSQPQGL